MKRTREDIENEIRDVIFNSQHTQDEKIKQLADYVILIAGHMALESINELNK